MSNKMLIDASHPEETRVVVTRGNRIEEFDFESEHKKQLKGNIYLARVTRVEPSLQAAFVEYGGNRHGFLAFSEIHPDYYQIPVADRLALLEAEERAAQEESDAADEPQRENGQKKNSRRKDKYSDTKAHATDTDIVSDDADDDDDSNGTDESENGEDSIELVGAEDALEEVPTYQRQHKRDYKIQEVVKRRQILLVQVVKEERGNKGAALTTYLSLAGRYSVLMPNTARGGGISRKITNINDRKRLKDIVKDLDVPKGMGVILRTAGANRTKAEIKRDYEYLMRLWENVRGLTLTSTAPALVYEEGSLIKRSIRDLYNKDIDEILVAGDKGYREAKDFMRMLMPSHAKVVQPYRDPVPIFARNGIETWLDRMLQPEVSLKSGGYLVINQAEALVAIDVNSGRSTKEHSVEETAVQTNLEAAEEVARQLRLRDLAGLIVIDFIDMEEKRNVRAVEKKLKDCLKDDRARIQVGRISHFGLMEMSRQRIRASVLESTMLVCPHCAGTGYIRSESSVALHVIRSIEEYLLRNGQNNIIVRTPVSTALYVLNHKRKVLSDLELRFGLTISIEADDTIGTQHLAIYKGTPAEGVPAGEIPLLPIAEPEEEIEDFVVEESSINEEENNHRHKNKKHRGERDHDKGEKKAEHNGERHQSDANSEDEHNKRRRRRGRRGGRRNRDYDGDRRRLPYAEPVGPFAASALAEIRHLRRSRYVPTAEPVGPHSAEILAEMAERKNAKRNQQHTPVSKETKNNIPAAEPVGEKFVSAQNIDVVITEEKSSAKPKRKRKTASKADTAVKSVENDVVLATEDLVTDSETSSTAPKAAADKKAKNTQKAKTTRKSAAKVKDAVPAKAEHEESQFVEPEENIINSGAATEIPEADTKPKTNRRKKAATEDTASDPIITSSETELSEGEKPKRGGWWQRKGFF